MLLYLPFVRGHFSGSDEYGLYQVTAAIYERGALSVEKTHHVHEGRNGKPYSTFGIGQSLAALPFYMLGSAAREWLPTSWIARLEARRARNSVDSREGPEIFAVCLYAPFVTGLLVGLFFLFERQLGVSRQTALLVSGLLGATTYVATMSSYFLRHSTEALLVMGSLYAARLGRHGASHRPLAAASLCACLAVLVRNASAAAAPVLAAYLLASLVLQTRRSHPLQQRATATRGLLAVAIPFAVIAGGYVALSLYQWGSVLSLWVSRNAVFTTPFHVGAGGLLFSPGSSLFLYSPLLCLLPWTFPPFWRSHRAEALAIAGLFALYLASTATFVFWHGMWSAPGPRLLFTLVPLLMLPLGPWLDHGSKRARLACAALLGSIGFLVQLPLLSTRWFGVIRAMGYREYRESMDFLFIPHLSPIVGSWRGLMSGRAHDLWIWKLWHGILDADAQPAAAAGLLLAWGLATLGCALLLARLADTKETPG